MFGSQVVDVAIGMVFVYLLLSLVCSAANELIETILKNRSKQLEKGIRSLLNNDGLAQKIYDHALVSGLYMSDRRKPSYIPARTFALALLNIVAPDATATGAGANPVQAVRAAVSNLPADHEAAPIKDALLALIDDAQGDVNKLRLNIQNWYDGAMDRVSGWYKRRVHVIIIILGLLVTIGLNVDSIAIFKALANDKALRESLVVAADAYAKANAAPSPSPTPSPSPSPSRATTPAPENSETGSATQPPVGTAATTQTAATSTTPSPTPTPDPCWAGDCQKDENSPKCKLKKNKCELERLGLPMGWRPPRDPWPGFEIWKGNVRGAWFSQIYEHGWGWLLTALAISLGAPFWFDLLNKFIVIRSTVKPKEKSQEDQSKD